MSIEAQFKQAYPGFALDVDLRLPGQGVSVLFGPSGCGKTTLLRCIAGLTRAAQGHLVVNGQRWQDEKRFVPTHERALGYVFQDANLFGHLSVRANLGYGQQRAKVPAPLVAFDELVVLLGLENLLERKPQALSGGERQRVAIARALLTSPAILLMDEPLAALDLARKNEFLPYLERLHARLQIPVVYVTHASDEVARLADHIVLMEQGRVLAVGPLTETLARLDLPLRLGEDAGVVLNARVSARDAQWHLAQVTLPGCAFWVRDGGHALGDAVRIRILARDISLALHAHGDTSIQNSVEVKVEEIGADSHPALCLARLSAGGSPLLARLTQRSAAHLGLHTGMRLWAQVKAVALIG